MVQEPLPHNFGCIHLHRSVMHWVGVFGAECRVSTGFILLGCMPNPKGNLAEGKDNQTAGPPEQHQSSKGTGGEPKAPEVVQEVPVCQLLRLRAFYETPHNDFYETPANIRPLLMALDPQGPWPIDPRLSGLCVLGRGSGSCRPWVLQGSTDPLPRKTMLRGPKRVLNPSYIPRV